MPPLISIVITAHNRKKYILDSVKSVLNQDANRNDYEIIVVKNFIDEEIDAFLEKEGVISIYTEEQPFGVKLAIGIDKSKGEVISFLDDDDEFSANKVSRLIEVFRDQRIVYHHSSIVAMDESGNAHRSGLSKNIPNTIVKEKFEPHDLKLVMKYKLDWYMSAITCRASLLKKHSSFIRKASASLDKLIFLLSTDSGGSLYFDSQLLTRYRIHESLTNKITGREDFLKARRDFYKRSLNNLIDASSYFKKNVTVDLINWEIMHARLLVYFFSDDVKDFVSAASIIKIILLSFMKRLNVIAYWSFLDLIRKISPEILRSSFYKRSNRKMNVSIPR